ncbi:MAG: hypothetical protein KGM99_09755, partial [Burkholderiales bacterium]|nr:hypothetical protein [Burkholderiales bacterium]
MMSSMNILASLISDVQGLQKRLQTSVTKVENNAQKFAAELQSASAMATPPALDAASVVAQSQGTTSANGLSAALTSGLDSKIQSQIQSLSDQAQSVSDVASLVTPTAVAANVQTVAPAPASAPSTATSSIAAINTTHPPYRVYDPSNPSAFVEKSNPGGGPNLLASDLVFNPDPRPDSPLSVPLPTAAYGSTEWRAQSQTYQTNYEKLCADNAVWNQKNMDIRAQTLLASPYAAFAGYQGPNLSTTVDAYHSA